MLASLLGVRLILWIGKAIPTPAPYDVMRALSHVRVINATDGNDGFQMTFTLGKDRAADYSLLASGALDPDQRVSLAVLLGASLEPLVNGIIYHHQVTPSNEPGMSTLTVSGRDLSVLLDLKEKKEPHMNQPDSVIVERVLANYATQGLLSPYQVTPTTEVPSEVQRVPRQHETDLKFIRRLAERNGFVFYIEPRTLGVTSAYWGPENRLGLPQPALSVNLGTATNVNTLTFTQDALAPVGTTGSFIEPITKMSIPIPPLPSLRLPPLAPRPIPPRRTTLQSCTANQNPAQAATTALATQTNAPDPVVATGELDTVRYGHVLRARRLVRVRGSGFSYNGVYKVSKVTHDIEPGQKYTQAFELKREGLGGAGVDNMNGTFYGKYRAIVTNIEDPLQIGRIKASVPDVMGDHESGWATPCAPFGGRGMGFFALPTVGAGVWIEFECGNPDYPIWSGCWWGEATEVPPLLLAPQPYKKVMVKTAGGHSIVLDDTPGTGGITLEASSGQKIVISSSGIEINNGQGGTIKLTGPQVSVNNGALEVT